MAGIRKIVKQRTHEGTSRLSTGHTSAFARSKSIDQQLEDDRERRAREIQLLILGGAGTGKSTFIKQMRLHRGDGYPDAERARLTPQIYENIMDGLNLVLDNMAAQNLSFQDPENQKLARELQEKFPRWHHYYIASTDNHLTSAIPASPAHKDSDPNPPPDYSQLVKYMAQVQRVWNDPGVQQCYRQKHLFEKPMANAEQYFLGNLPRLSDPGYCPTIEDVLHIRKPTVGVHEHQFYINGLAFRVIDVAGQKNQRKKWIHFFDNVTAVTFFSALSEYAERLEEDASLNSLQDSLNTFRDVSHNSYLSRTDFVLLLNKKDLFEERLTQVPLTHCFPDYKGPNTPPECTAFIKEEFLRRKPESKRVYVHVSCAIDVTMMKQLIADVMQIIIEINIRKAAPL